MNACDLMVGDYIKSLSTGMIGKIVEIGLSCVVVDGKIGARQHIAYDEIVPIFITKPILLCNGWKYEDITKSTLILDVDKPMAGDGFECQWMRFFPDKTVFMYTTATGIGSIVCKYVHELQHIIMCIGFNKKIEL